MSRTKIDWADFSINPVKGLCPVACEYCYARRMYKRFKWPERIEFQYAHFRKSVSTIKKPSKIFVGSTMELFGEWIMDRWLADIFNVARLYPRHTFIFLTKKPENLQTWSPFPDNCWIGASVTNMQMLDAADLAMQEVEANVKFLSFEPLLDHIGGPLRFPLSERFKAWQWLIIGQQTPIRAAAAPQVEWIREIVEAADKAKVPVFLKDNLSKLLQPIQGGLFVAKDVMKSDCWLRQEFPK